METIHLTGGTKWTALFSTCFVPIYTDLSLGCSPCCQMFRCQSELLPYTKNDSRRRRSLFLHLLLFYPCPGDSTCSCLLRNVTDTCLCCLMFLIKRKKGGLVLPAEIFYLFQFALQRRSLEHFRLSQTLIVIEHLRLHVLGTERNS